MAMYDTTENMSISIYYQLKLLAYLFDIIYYGKLCTSAGTINVWKYLLKLNVMLETTMAIQDLFI